MKKILNERSIGIGLLALAIIFAITAFIEYRKPTQVSVTNSTAQIESLTSQMNFLEAKNKSNFLLFFFKILANLPSPPVTRIFFFILNIFF